MDETNDNPIEQRAKQILSEHQGMEHADIWLPLQLEVGKASEEVAGVSKGLQQVELIADLQLQACKIVAREERENGEPFGEEALASRLEIAAQKRAEGLKNQKRGHAFN